jgi:PAS domain S-box-containing protein
VATARKDATASVVILDSKIVEANAAALDLVGISAERAVGTEVLEFVAPESLEVIAARRAVLRSGRSPRPETIALLREDGRRIEVEISTSLVPWGEATAMLVTMWDLEAAREAEAGALRGAIAAGEFVVHYQPVVALDEGTVVGMEALVRWAHPTRGLLAPFHFIDLAERSGVIVDLGAFVLEEACFEAARWVAQGQRRAVSVNLSTRQLNDDGLVARVLRLLDESGLPPDLLHLEVTETSLVRDVDQARRVLGALAAVGIGISIDDFGTGWASLTYLREFPVSSLKIDRTFVAGLGSGGPDDAIVSSIVTLGAELGLVVTAEGVETEGQRRRLLDLGCTMGQGYLFGWPGPSTLTAAVAAG